MALSHRICARRDEFDHMGMHHAFSRFRKAKIAIFGVRAQSIGFKVIIAIEVTDGKLLSDIG
jgi:hypothetical protein